MAADSVVDALSTKGSYSISKSIVSRRQAADCAVARQGEGNNNTIALEIELAPLESNVGMLGVGRFCNKRR